ncbi:unnamed protein product, partial [Prorocentrum cordatum]
DAISQGYAPDGGLFVPERLPQIGAADLQRWRGLSFEAMIGGAGKAHRCSRGPATWFSPQPLAADSKWSGRPCELAMKEAGRLGDFWDVQPAEPQQYVPAYLSAALPPITGEMVAKGNPLRAAVVLGDTSNLYEHLSRSKLASRAEELQFPSQILSVGINQYYGFRFVSMQGGTIMMGFVAGEGGARGGRCAGGAPRFRSPPVVGDELPAAELAEVARGCYADFACGDVVPLVRAAGSEGLASPAPALLLEVGDLLVAELFHGPTFCFKDLGQQPLVRLLARFAEKRGLRRTMLVSTTGDTGPAAMRAVSDAGSSSLGIVVFYPDGQISELQRRQMSTAADGCRARVAPFEGGGDDMDLPLKRLGADRAFAEEHGLCGINSYNLGRPVAQTVFYFWTYFRALDERGLATGAEIDIALPSGALGNLAAGFMSKLMGLPVRKLIAGVNSNDITHRTISSGDFSRSERMEKTLSDAINIQVPYNMERILYYLTGEDAAQTAAWHCGDQKGTDTATPRF